MSLIANFLRNCSQKFYHAFARLCALQATANMVYLSIALALSLILISTINQAISIRRMNEMTDARARAWHTLYTLTSVLSMFKDLETGSRGYAITSDAAYLAPFYQSVLTIDKEYAHLRATFEQPKLFSKQFNANDWKALDVLVIERQKTATRIVERRTLEGEKILEDKAMFDHGKLVMDQIRTEFGKLDAILALHINQINKDVTLLRKKAVLNATINTAIALLLITTAIAILLAERKKRLSVENQLIDNNKLLEKRVNERTHELKLARNEIAQFAYMQNMAIEAERRRLSSEVHDQIGQIFTAIKMITGSIAAGGFPPGQKKAMAQALEAGIASTRRITSELRPPLLDDFGLEAAVSHYASELNKIAPLQLKVDMADDDLLNEAQALCLFRVVQEAMTNVLRHANASSATIMGKASDHFYTLTITDNGKGFDANKIRDDAIGLASMRERMSMLNGNFSISSSKKGAVVRVACPVLTSANQISRPFVS